MTDTQQPNKLTVYSKAIAELEEEAGPRLDPNGEPQPSGLLMADLVANGVSARGWSVENRWATYTAHAFDVQKSGGGRYDVEITLTDTASGTFVVTAKPRSGFFRKVFASKVDPNELALLRHDIDAAIAADNRAEAGGGWVVDAKA